MAPFNSELDVRAQSSRVISWDGETILVEAGLHAPLRWFLDQTMPSPVVDRTPRTHTDPRHNKHKRRKTKHEVDETHSPIDERGQGHYEIVLGRIALNLEITPGQHESDSGVDRKDSWLKEIPVRLVGVTQTNHDLEIRLTHASSTTSPILVVHTDKIDPAHLQSLRTCVMPSTKNKYGYWDNGPIASIFSCDFRQTSTDDLSRIQLVASTAWYDRQPYESKTDLEVLADFFPMHAPALSQKSDWNPRDFYENVYTPPKDESIQIHPAIESQLYPFQQRTVRWMLNREGASYTTDGQIVRGAEEHSVIRTYLELSDAFGGEIFLDPVLGTLSSTAPPEPSACSGGILAEEMGLGKTVEIVAVVTLHPRLNRTASNSSLTASKATLIISPASILQQWKTELSRHAPALKVYLYEGMSNTSKSRKHGESHTRLVEMMTEEFDIVLTTYQTLTREIHFAIEPPDRAMRRPRAYERAKCPLVEIEWWRICLDEAQMLETGVSAAARVACQLPRVHSWAVSGTPVKRNVEDLHGLMVFLRLEPFASSLALWQNLLSRSPGTARQLFRTIALRHTKAQVREDIQLPPQKRMILTMPFTTVENQQYLSLFKEMCTAVGVNTDGSPASDDWDPEDGTTVASMRSWLAKLRRSCLHPQIVGHSRRLGRNTGPLRTVDEVLDAMIDQNDVLRRTEERAAVQAQLITGHVLGNFRGDQARSVKALEVYQLVITRSQDMVQECRDRLETAQAAINLRENMKESDSETSSDESDALLGRYRAGVRSALQLLHTCVYFAASAKFQIKTNEQLTKPDSDMFKRLEEEENTLYDQAKAIRREILSDANQKADRAMKQIKYLNDNHELTSVLPVKDIERLGGIASRNIVENSYDLFDTIREICKTLVTWRDKMVSRLNMQLVDAEVSDNELKGDEYEQSTKHQDELYVYFDAFKALQADLVRCINGDAAPLIDNEAKGLLRAAKRWLDPDVVVDLKTQVHAPELTVELFEFRQRIRARIDALSSVRGLIAEARRLQDPAFHKNLTEAGLAASIVSHLQPIFTQYTKAIASFEKEVDLFRNTQNLRLEYYRQLQEVSDDVAPFKDELDDELDTPAFENALAEEEHHSSLVSQLRTKHRFLSHLKEESGKEEAARICVICQTSFDNGVLTICGHQYCKECIQEWWRSHRSCPVCKRALALVDFHNITYKPRGLRAQEEDQPEQNPPGTSTTSEIGSSRQTSIYSEVDDKLMDQIKSYDLSRSYGTKIDTLARHLLWIREHDPGAKSIVFSQYREYLDVLSTAFHEFRIGHVRLGQPGAVERFRHEASKDCLLLDAKTDSSGLTLVNATHVFICEPLVQTAVELQAIARVHRIGQTRPTTVWMYLVNDTVEESIYAISKARRIAQVQAKLAADDARHSGTSTPLLIGDHAIDKANSDELQTVQLSKLLESGKTSGELVGKDDLWECLFGNAQNVVDATRPQLQAEVDRNLRAHAAEQRAREQR